MKSSINYTSDSTILPEGTDFASDKALAFVANLNLTREQRAAFDVISWANNITTNRTDDEEGQIQLERTVNKWIWNFLNKAHYEILEPLKIKYPRALWNKDPKEADDSAVDDLNREYSAQIGNLLKYLVTEVISDAERREVRHSSFEEILAYFVNFIADILNPGMGVIKIHELHTEILNLLRNASDNLDIIESAMTKEDEGEKPTAETLALYRKIFNSLTKLEG